MKRFSQRGAFTVLATAALVCTSVQEVEAARPSPGRVRREHKTFSRQRTKIQRAYDRIMQGAKSRAYEIVTNAFGSRRIVPKGKEPDAPGVITGFVRSDGKLWVSRRTTWQHPTRGHVATVVESGEKGGPTGRRDTSMAPDRRTKTWVEHTGTRHKVTHVEHYDENGGWVKRVDYKKGKRPVAFPR